MKERINSALDSFYEHSIISVFVTILVFYAVWYLPSLLGLGVVAEYAIKLIVSLVIALGHMWLRKGHMYSCGLKKHPFLQNKF